MYRSSPSVDITGTSLMDNRLIAATRLILALSAVLISDDTLRVSPYAETTRNVLFLYIAYSSILYILAARRNQHQRTVPIWSYWLDIGWYTVLVGFSGGTNSFLFFGFLFAILVASFNRGFRSGVLATTVSALIFIAVGMAREFVWSEFDNERLLTRSLYVVVLGYLVARWAATGLR